MIMGDRVALLRHGCIAQIGTAKELYRQPVDLAAARFLSPLGEVETHVHSGIAQTPLGPVAAPGFADGTPVTVAIRPVGGVQVRAESPGTPGRIVARRDAIGVDLLEVKIDGLDAPLGVRQPANGTLTPGQDIFLVLNPEHVLVFGRD